MGTAIVRWQSVASSHVMGIGASIQDNMASMQEQMKRNQAEMMERQRRLMMSQQMALARERMYWFGGAACLALTAGLVTKKPAALIPVGPLTIITAYHWDMGYGDLINRVNAMHQDILADERYWFFD